MSQRNNRAAAATMRLEHRASIRPRLADHTQDFRCRGLALERSCSVSASVFCRSCASTRRRSRSASAASRASRVGALAAPGEGFGVDVADGAVRRLGIRRDFHAGKRGSEASLQLAAMASDLLQLNPHGLAGKKGHRSRPFSNARRRRCHGQTRHFCNSLPSEILGRASGSIRTGSPRRGEARQSCPHRQKSARRGPLTHKP